MPVRRFGWIAVLLAASHLTAAAGATDPCKLIMYPRIPVKMDDLRPVITASINGVDARFIVDTGSFWDFLSPAAAAQFNLPLSYAPPFFYVNGVGGAVVPRIATAKTFTVAGITSHDARFLVGNNDFLGGQIGILGQNIFRIADVDYDFADGVLRFVEPQHCGKEDELVYWTKTQPVGVVDLHRTSNERPYLTGKAVVNGHAIQVLFDTGSPRTILSLDAARRAGITSDSPGVVEAGVTSGLGKDTVEVWVAPVASFEIGGETIERTRVLMGGIGLPDLGVDMLLGSDFFLAHHIYVAYSQNKLYFTYNGGVVFDLNARRPARKAGTPKTSADDSQALSAATSDIPMDAAGFMRRGMAHASRHEYPEAIADLTHACSLDPADGDCRYQRGLAYLNSSQRELALADFSAAIRLQPDDFEAHLSRAQLELPGQPADAESDLDAVDRFAPQQADLRLMVAQLYGAAGQYAGAVHQYDLWVEYHPHDIRLPSALSSRCGSEAAANLDLDRALEDCGSALGLMRSPAHSATALSNRGLVYLRQGKLDSALADFEAALKLQPRLPAACYGRGLVEIRKGLRAEGQAHLAAIRAQHPDLARHLSGLGFTP
ncbi:MAG TPA: aspartyl protease family protein [Steroidobacteraceae bacterium]|jgi:tetratricopeptide (TPR) repeat protein|nr:aspartyl protease family protein [Steroidobacteraceae bacterium]